MHSDLFFLKKYYKLQGKTWADQALHVKILNNGTSMSKKI